MNPDLWSADWASVGPSFLLPDWDVGLIYIINVGKQWCMSIPIDHEFFTYDILETMEELPDECLLLDVLLGEDDGAAEEISCKPDLTAEHVRQSMEDGYGDLEFSIDIMEIFDEVAKELVVTEKDGTQTRVYRLQWGDATDVIMVNADWFDTFAAVSEHVMASTAPKTPLLFVRDDGIITYVMPREPK